MTKSSLFSNLTQRTADMDDASSDLRDRSNDEDELDSVYKTDGINIVLSRSESSNVQNYLCRRLEG
jgi:hypothetical protein